MFDQFKPYKSLRLFPTLPHAEPEVRQDLSSPKLVSCLTRQATSVVKKISRLAPSPFKLCSSTGSRPTRRARRDLQDLRPSDTCPAFLTHRMMASRTCFVTTKPTLVSWRVESSLGGHAEDWPPWPMKLLGVRAREAAQRSHRPGGTAGGQRGQGRACRAFVDGLGHHCPSAVPIRAVVSVHGLSNTHNTSAYRSNERSVRNTSVAVEVTARPGSGGEERRDGTRVAVPTPP